MLRDESLIEAAQRVANCYAKVANKHMGSNLPIPVPMDFDLCKFKPKAAGEASSLMAVSINHVLFEQNVEYILNDTIPHEIGHLVQYDKFSNKGAIIQGHGAEWNEIMRRIGKNPHKFHELDVNDAIKFHKIYKATKQAKKK